MARGFGTSQPGAEQLQIQVPNEKVKILTMKIYIRNFFGNLFLHVHEFYRLD